MVVVVYTSSASASTAIKNKQKAIIDYLTSRKIEHEIIDITIHPEAKDHMRNSIPEDIKKKFEECKKLILPPQVYNDDEYCGDYDMFFNAREMELVHTFFKVCPTPQGETTMKSINWATTEDKEHDVVEKKEISVKDSNISEEAEKNGVQGDKEADNMEEGDAEAKPGSDVTKEGLSEKVDGAESEGECGEVETKEDGRVTEQKGSENKMDGDDIATKKNDREVEEKGENDDTEQDCESKQEKETEEGGESDDLESETE